jgi:hypothetical protein
MTSWIKKGISNLFKYRETSGPDIVWVDLVTKDFDNNDLGINFQTNYYSLYGNASYRILNYETFNSFRINYIMYPVSKETGKFKETT